MKLAQRQLYNHCIVSAYAHSYLEVARVVLELQLLGGGRHHADKDDVAQAAGRVVGIHKVKHRRSTDVRLDSLCDGDKAHRCREWCNGAEGSFISSWQGRK